MTASESTPAEGESRDGSEQYNEYVSIVLSGEIERAADSLKGSLFGVSQKLSSEDEVTQEDIEVAESRLSEVEHSLQLLKESVQIEK